MKPTINILFVFILAIVTSCLAPKVVSTIESNYYDNKTNHTTFSKIPFGSISIPGKWTKVSYNQVSGQHNFKNADSIFSAVAINRASLYPFYKPKMTSNEIVKDMYEWDSNYWVTQTNGNRKTLKQDTTNHFIIWKFSADNNYKVDNYYLFGSENGVVFTVFIDTDKWDLTQKINFLQMVYKNKTVGTCCN